jgi:hypothetical protein
MLQEHLVEHRREFAVAVVDQELHPLKRGR